MDGQRSKEHVALDQDFIKFRRIPEGDCELLSARFSNHTFGRHSHDRYAVGVITGGVERMYYRGRYCLGGTGSVVTISPGEIHDGLPAHEQGWMYRMLYLDPQWLNRTLMPKQADDYIHLFKEAFDQQPELADTFSHHHQVIESSQCSLERESLLLELVTQLFERRAASLTSVDALEKQAVRRVRCRLEDDFDKPVTLEQLAQMVDLDPLYLIRVFKKNVGVSPHSYLIQVRVAQVQRLLRAGVSIADAALACGFFDQSHMTRAFKKVVGITPGGFRIGHLPA
ncbi:AraC family transcriptional regulator [Pseudomonas aeruginosa]|uniref:helix-turn-helix transcriptional regulator n=1 Tax=Pseudomonas aeruginosa TaxID=287 RepID=UPI0018C480F0|nr:AraC family transcriptional regulator [Pseudomonas aeruginosa]EKL8567085.1 AraC family transcriptional regulator [Pseudomonas aeruginosa]MBG5221776.1 AraC family transcriptional regulator [Pseudomonas aeruginosa]MBG6333328.1 AraC family transcriptional regulator [Pseudomonas aeruginosa]MBH9451288.1 AraC family transcriptional regulator [Pseudomonas aeruginosa]MCS7727876.1 AraC family transcriptional regulator [Pseudomonas aeruginosa]